MNDIDSPFNACMFREECRTLRDQFVALKAYFNAEREAHEQKHRDDQAEITLQAHRAARAESRVAELEERLRTL